MSNAKKKTFSVDTNILIRYITQDDNKQSKLATDFIEGKALSKSHCFVTLPVIIETVWVLKRLYNADRNQIANVVETLLNTRNFIVQHSNELENALDRFREFSADFSDCLIIELSNAMHATTDGTLEVYTFDKKAVKAGMTILS